MWLRWKLFWPYRFAHHPLCERFSGHVFRIGKLYICQGCTLVYSGLLIGGLVFSLVPFVLSYWLWSIIAGALVLPTFIVHFSSLSRVFTRVARFSFGLFFGWMIGGVVKYPNWLFRGITIGAAIITYLLFRIVYRRSKKQRDECSGCPELAKGGICSGYEERMEAEREYSSMLLNCYSLKLKNMLRRKLPQ
jgi:uncharacterized membrane protein